MAYQTVVFDLDGTLLDTLDDLALAVNHALAEKGFPPQTTAEVRLHTGNGIGRLIDQSVPAGCDPATRDAVFAEFKAYYALHNNDHTAPYPGIPQMVGRLRERGVRCALASNKADFAVQALVRDHFDGVFDAAAGEREGIARKPAPDMVDALLDELGCTREGLAYVGDSEVDVATAANLGCDCVTCTWGFRDPEALLAAGASCLVDSVDELERILLG